MVFGPIDIWIYVRALAQERDLVQNYGSVKVSQCDVLVIVVLTILAYKTHELRR